MQSYRDRVDQALEQIIANTSDLAGELHQAMHYSTFNGGKRVRPLLVYLTGEALAVPTAALDNAACAVEFIHCYSLVHDDMPAMDDDDFRRGKPSCHKAFGESVAILAGDALLTLAFEVMARATVEEGHLSRKVRCVEEVGRMAGAEGMVGGQVLDINFEPGRATED